MSETATHDIAARSSAGSAWARVRTSLRRLLADRSHDGIARRTAIFVFGVRVTSAAIAYLAQILLARWMGTFEYGIYVFVWTWVLILGSLSGLGFGVISARFVPHHVERGETALLRGYILGSRLAGFAAATLVAVLGVALILWLGPAIDSHYVWPLVLAMICLPLFTLTETQDGIARAFDRPGIGLLPPYVLRPVLILVFMVGAHVAGFTDDATTALICAVLATWGTGVVQLVFLHRALGVRVDRGPRAYAPALWFGAGLPLLVADGAHVLLLNVDVLVLAAFVPPDQVGIYYAVTKTLVLGAFVAFAVGAAVAHRFGEYHSSGDRARLQAFVVKSTAWTFWPTLTAVALMVVLGRPFLSLFGPAFVEGYPLMLILSAAVLLRASIGPAERMLAVLGEQRMLMHIVLATLVAAVALLVTLVPLFGVLGAALAIALAAVVETVLLAVMTRRRLGLDIGIWRAFGRSAAP